MGIPSYFRSLLQKYTNIIQTDISNLQVDTFFLDFNSMIYQSYLHIQKDSSISTPNEMESKIITHTIERLDHMIHDHVKPHVEVYISLDGVAPMAKMIQQRSRRYKSIYLEKLLDSFKIQHSIPCRKVQWNPSSHICPGTIFMSKLEKELRIYKKQKKTAFQLILNGSGIPGEGEHKFLSKIRSLRNHSLRKNMPVVIYSPDGDLLTLSLLTMKSNLWIMRIPDPHSTLECNYHVPYIYFPIDLLRSHLMSSFTWISSPLHLIQDYNLLLMLAGNDFVPSLPYMKIRSKGFDKTLRLYESLQSNDAKFHFINNKNEIQFSSLLLFFQILKETEKEDFIYEWKRYQRDSYGSKDSHRTLLESSMSPFDIYASRLQHVSFFHPDHPIYSKYGHLWKTIRFEDIHWKDQFHRAFFSEKPWSLTFQEEIVQNYLESLFFTWFYYTEKCPSFHWHYRFRMAPLVSDIVDVLERTDLPLFQSQIVSSFRQDTSQPLVPYEQLLYILPPSAVSILPKTLQSIPITYPQLYPKEETIQLDALAGGKFIYSETILPTLSIDQIKEWVSQSTFSNNEKKRNTLLTRPYF